MSDQGIYDIPARPQAGGTRSRTASLHAALKKLTGKPDGTVELLLSLSALDALTTAQLFAMLPAEEVSVRLEAVQTELDLDDAEGR